MDRIRRHIGEYRIRHVSHVLQVNDIQPPDPIAHIPEKTIYAICRFDRELRLAVYDALKAIEVEYRWRICDALNELEGERWISKVGKPLKPGPILDKHRYWATAIKYEIKQKGVKPTVKDVRSSAPTRSLPEAQRWYARRARLENIDSLFETQLPIQNEAIVSHLSLGALAHLYQCVRLDVVKHAVADFPSSTPDPKFNLHAKFVGDYLVNLSSLRNHIAHHQMLWGRKIEGSLKVREWDKSRRATKMPGDYVDLVLEILTASKAGQFRHLREKIIQPIQRLHDKNPRFIEPLGYDQVPARWIPSALQKTY